MKRRQFAAAAADAWNAFLLTPARQTRAAAAAATAALCGVTSSTDFRQRSKTIELRQRAAFWVSRVSRDMPLASKTVCSMAHASNTKQSVLLYVHHVKQRDAVSGDAAAQFCFI